MALSANNTQTFASGELVTAAKLNATKIIQLGTTTENNAFTGSAGQITYDSTLKVLVAHDGSTAGGTPIARQNAFNVKDYGAKGDDSTDDTDSFSDCFAAALAAGGGEIYIPNATYKLAAGAVSGKLRVPGNSVVVGNGSTLKIYNGFFRRGLLVDTVNNVTLQNFTIELADTLTSGGVSYYGLAIQDSSKVLVDNVKVYDSTWSSSVTSAYSRFTYGFLVSESTAESQADGSYTPGTDERPCDDVTFRNCVADGCYQYGFETFPKEASRGLLIENCTAVNVGNDNGAALDPAGFKVGQCYDGAIVRGNLAKDCWHGLIAANWSNLEMSNNSVVEFLEGGIVLAANDHSYFTDHGMAQQFTRRFCRIANNQIQRLTAPGARTEQGIGFFNPTFTDNGPIIIDGNSIKVPTAVDSQAEANGITIDAAAAVPGIVIRNNYVEGGMPLYLYDSTFLLASPIIDGNYFENTDVSEDYRSCYVHATSALIRNNVFVGQTRYGIRVKGTGSRLIGNSFLNGDSASVGDYSVILVEDDAANDYYVLNNTVAGGNIDQFLNSSDGTPNVYSMGNLFDSNLKYYASTSTAMSDGAALCLGGGSASNPGYGSKIFTGSAAPTGGTYRIGDMVFDTSPSAGGTIGWVCTVGGTPGTWKTFGSIAS
jgi:hypothetical protein